MGYCHNICRGSSDGKPLHCREADALYTCDYEGIRVECARMAILEGNEYVGVDGR